MWVRFTRAYDWSPVRYGGRVDVSYPAGLSVNMPHAGALKAIADGAAERIAPPPRGDRGKADGEDPRPGP